MGRSDTRKLGKYVVLERVAEGPLTEVLKARLDGIAGFSRIFAIKRLRPEVARHPDAQAVVEAHAREAAVLSHGNIVQLLDLGREGGAPYIVLEWVDGWSLAALLGRARDTAITMPVGHATWIGLQVLKALEYAHHREVVRDGESTVLRLVHGAVGPDDVLISRAGEVKVTDFGLARATDRVAALDPTLIAPRQEIRAPELSANAETTIAADLWGAARLVRACLVPDTLGDPGPFAPLREIRADVPEALAKTIDAALSIDPAARPTNATEMKDAFTDLLHDLGDVSSSDTLSRWIADQHLAPEPTPSEPLHDLPDVALDFSERTDESGNLDPDLEEESTSPIGNDEHIILDEDARTQVQAAFRPPPKKAAEPVWEDNAATKSDPELVRKLAEMRESAHAEPSAPKETRASALIDSDLLDDTDNGPGSQPSSRMAWLAGIGALCIGVAIGGGAATMWGGTTPPMLDVRAAPSVRMTVLVDGRGVSGPTSLTPGIHKLRVEVPGVTPWQVDLTLQDGEYRLVMVESNRITVDPAAAATLQPAPK